MKSRQLSARILFAAVLAAVLWSWAIAGIAKSPAESAEPGSITGRVFLDENADTFFKECDCDCGLEDIPIRLFRDACSGLIVQTVRTDAEGWFRFPKLEAGNYCLMPEIKINCEGYLPTTSITQKVVVRPGEVTEAEWFAFDHYLEVED